MYPVLKIMHMLNFLNTFSVDVTIGEETSVFCDGLRENERVF